MMNSKTKVGEPKQCSWCGWYADTSILLSSHIPTYRKRRPSLPDIFPHLSLVPGERRRESATAIRKGLCCPLDIPMYTVGYPPPAPGALNVGSGSWSIGGIRFRGKCHTYPPDIHIMGPVWYPPSAPGALNVVSGSSAELVFVLVLRREDRMSRRLCIWVLQGVLWLCFSTGKKKCEQQQCDLDAKNSLLAEASAKVAMKWMEKLAQYYPDLIRAQFLVHVTLLDLYFCSVLSFLLFVKFCCLFGYEMFMLPPVSLFVLLFYKYRIW
jgi:hypothetical protein